MNWNSGSVDAVSKERIWKEHVLTEKNTARVHEDFRCNPLKNHPPTADIISKRPARFLDRSAVIMDMLQKRLHRVERNEEKARFQKLEEQGMLASARSGDGNNAAAASGRSQFDKYQVQTRGMYSGGGGGGIASTAAAGGSVRGGNEPPLQKPSNLPPISSPRKSMGMSTSSTNNPQSPRTKGAVGVHDFNELYSTAQLTPREKYATPQTAMQELGWWNQPLINNKELEPRFRYGLSSCDVTKNGSAFVGSRRK